MRGNQLAELQKRLFENDISESSYQERKAAFLKLYFELRQQNECSWFSRLSLKTRKMLHPIILTLNKLKNRLGGFSYCTLSDEREGTEKPIIFAVTHVGKYDIENISAAIEDHYYLLTVDYEHLQGTVYEPFLALNGVIYFNEFVKADRQNAVRTMIRHLQNGGNLMYFPEGIWNLTPNLPVLPCFWGIIDVARAGGATIIPIATEQYGKTFKICIGRNFDVQVYGNDPVEKSKAICSLRDALASLKWKIWESELQQERFKMDVCEWDKYVADRFSEWSYFNHAYIERLTFKPKDMRTNQPRPSKEDVFAFLEGIQKNTNTAFLFNKRLTGTGI